MRLPPRPTIYEMSTAIWLERLGRERGGALDLGDVPAERWDAIAALPVDAVWLMGVWERSPAGLAVARADPELEAANRAALPDLRDEDVIGSPYCVRDYVGDSRFGGPGALARARADLAARDVALILDFVPNHVAPDHPRTGTRPECFVRGTEDDLARDPEAFLRTPAGISPGGRDTTSASTTGSSTRAPTRSGATCGPTPATRSVFCASSRTTTSRAQRPRSAPEQARAAAVVMSTQQGARLYRDGQFEGRRVRIPVFLGRAPDEPPDRELAAFYARLLQAVAASDLQRGDWRLCDCDGWPDNASFRSLVAWCWSAGTSRHLVVVNLSGAPAQARVQLPWDDLAGRTWELTDRLDGQVFERAGDALEREGLYVALEGWQSHFLAVA